MSIQVQTGRCVSRKLGTGIVFVAIWMAMDSQTILAQQPISCGDQKVFVCHKGKNTLCIDENAVQAHLDHGDFLGPCNAVECEVVAFGGEITCNDTTITLATFTDVAGATYNWSGPGNFVSVLQMPETNLPGAYIVTMTDTVNGCMAFDTAIVTENRSLPEVEINEETLTCTVISVALSTNLAIQGFMFNWTGPQGYASTEPNPETTLLGEYILTVVNSLNGCKSADTTYVLQNLKSPPGGTATAQGVLTCSHMAITLTGACDTNGVTYTWSGPNGFTSSEQVTQVNSPGIYSLLLTDTVNGCTSSANVPVEQNITVPAGTAATVSGMLTCTDSVVTLSGFPGAGGNVFGWQGPDGFSSNIISPDVTLPGDYAFVVADTSSGCSNTAFITVLQDTLAPQGFSASASDTINCTTNDVILSAFSSDNGAVYSWTGPQDFSSNEQYTVTNIPGNYNAMAVNPVNGCLAIKPVLVATESCQ